MKIYLQSKIVISKKHLLPELYKQFRLEDMIFFSDEVLKFIIEEKQKFITTCLPFLPFLPFSCACSACNFPWLSQLPDPC